MQLLFDNFLTYIVNTILFYELESFLAKRQVIMVDENEEMTGRPYRKEYEDPRQLLGSSL